MKRFFFIFIFSLNSLFVSASTQYLTYKNPSKFSIQSESRGYYSRGQFRHSDSASWHTVYYDNVFIFNIAWNGLAVFNSYLAQMRENPNLILYRKAQPINTYYTWSRLNEKFDLQIEGKEPFKIHIKLGAGESLFLMRNNQVAYHPAGVTVKKEEQRAHKYFLHLKDQKYKIGRDLYRHVKNLIRNASSGNYFIVFNIERLRKPKLFQSSSKVAWILQDYVVEMEGVSFDSKEGDKIVTAQVVTAD